MALWQVTAGNRVVGVTQSVRVSPNDNIWFYIEEVASNEFLLQFDDYTYNGGFLSWGVYWNTDGVPFTTAQPSVFEAYGQAACNQFPSSNDIGFYNVAMYQAGPSWNSYNYVASDNTPADWLINNFPAGSNFVYCCNDFVDTGNCGTGYGNCSIMGWDSECPTACTTNSQCCTGNCVSHMCCATSCTVDADCCTSNCVGGTCR
jgi:hypothetical protein